MNAGLASVGLAAAAVVALLSCGSGGVGMSAAPRLPVLFVHGSGLDAGSWAALTARLRSQGWPKEYLLAVDLKPNDGANVLAAVEQLQPAVIQLLEAAAGQARQEGWAPPEKVAIVAHSMGAVSGRWLAAKVIPERVSVFVAIAGANYGTDALCGFPGAGNAEMCPAFPAPGESFVLDSLNGTTSAPADPTPFGVGEDPAGMPSEPPTRLRCIGWHTVLIDPDEWIQPASSARLPGSGGHQPSPLPAGVRRMTDGEYLITGSIRHDDLPSHLPVVQLVELLIEVPPDCPAAET